GPATAAQLRRPSGVAVDGSGILYIADSGSNRIRRVSTAGMIDTIAGNGLAGAGGDDGAATSAQLNRPWAVAVDDLGNVLVADRYNYRVRKLSQSLIRSSGPLNAASSLPGPVAPG